MELCCNESSPPAVSLLAAETVKSNLKVKWGKETKLQVGGETFTSDKSIARYLARANPKTNLYSSDVLSMTEVDHWLDFASSRLLCASERSAALDYLEKVLTPSTFLVGEGLTLADFAVWNALRSCGDVSGYKNISRYNNHLTGLPQFVTVGKRLPKGGAAPAAKGKGGKGDAPAKTKKKDEGKFIELEGAVDGKVVVRFPPEASGYLHIGHAKAALLNQYYQKTYNGKLVMRFDDTNPAKENADFEQIILEDVAMLGIKPDIFSFTSNHFERMLQLCEKLIKDGNAFVDDTEGETMKLERAERKNSKHRDNTVDKNLSMWGEMKSGTTYGQTCAVRAKIDMKSDNGCLRDPTIYRCKPESHPHTKDKYKVYPTYDFACPIVDSVEGVTHALRTTEYLDRDDQYFWFLEKLGLRKLHIWAYSRLNLQHTVLSKRKLTWFVEAGHVSGWDDPRFPTVRGVLRRGMTVEGLTQFIIAQGGSRSVVTMEWDKIWSFNKKVIDPIAPRYFALLRKDVVPVYVEGATESSQKQPKHPKNADVGEKTVYYSSKVYVEGEDAKAFAEGEMVTFINWGNLIITGIKRNSSGDVESLTAKLNLDNRDFKKTIKITWLADHSEAEHIPVQCVHYGDLLTKPVLAPDDDFKDYINHDSKTVTDMLGDPGLVDLQKGDTIQLQRRGYYICDKPAGELNIHTSTRTPCVLINIPDGHQKEMPTSGSKAKSAADKKEKGAAQVSFTSPLTGSVSALDLHNKIVEQGGTVRDLKAKNASKPEVEAAVKQLLSLKSDYKKAAGEDWKPGQAPPPAAASSAGGSALDLHNKIVEQGNTVRDLKGKKAGKAEVEAAVKMLLSLKADFKSATGKDWKPGQAPPAAAAAPAAASSGGGSALDLHNKIVEQGNTVRDLKGKKAGKAEVEAAVKMLLSLKADFKSATGKDWKPGQGPPAAAPTPAESDLINKIAEQGNTVRDLKSKKAGKADIDAAVKVLLALKAEYKSATGKDFKPGQAPPAAAAAPAAASTGGQSESGLNNKIVEQGNTVRDLKSKKAGNADIDAAVKVLLALKAEYKSATGKDWKPGQAPPAAAAPAPAAASSTSQSAAGLYQQVADQGDLVRKLKSEKAGKDQIKAAVDVLLKLKADYKSSTGEEWKPGMAPAAAANPGEELNKKIAEQGNKVRTLKGEKADKAAVDAAVKELLSLKAQYKEATGSDWKPAAGDGGRAKKEAKPKEAKPKQEKQKQEKPKQDKKAAAAAGDGKKTTRLGMEATKEDNLPEWYSQVITKAEMIEYYDVSGCYILRPWSYAIWEVIKDFFDTEIKKLGVENCYFPIFVSHAALEKEKDHIADFAPEVAWVTKSGQSDLAEPIAIRPTSETVMYPAYAKWIQSHRDLPIKLNQWNNVVRWEFKHPQPFLRTREFLWNEGHTAHSNLPDAEEEVMDILELYARIYEEYLAIPVQRGRKTEKEKFAGGDYTTTVEAYISASGRAIQGATSHHLGQNFSKMFNIVFEDPETKKPEYVFQNSWGITTRTIGVLVMVHGDNKGLVLPPKVAAIQAVVIPCGITANLSEADKNSLLDSCKELEKTLKAAGVKSKADLRDNYSPGWKYNHWELKGVPIRIELGPRDVAQNKFVVVRRDTGAKQDVVRADAGKEILKLLDTIQKDLFNKAKAAEDENIIVANTWDEMCAGLDKSCLLLSPFCGDIPCEEAIKKDSARDVVVEEGAPAMGAKGLCIPFKQPADIKPNMKCVYPSCKNAPKHYTLFGRSY